VGLFHKFHQFHRHMWQFWSSPSHHAKVAPRRRHVFSFEQVESRQMLSFSPMPIQIGAVYYEDNGPEDTIGDRIEITWSGGAAGTQLTQLTVDTDKGGDGLTVADAFFDTAPGGLGDYGSVPLAYQVQGDFEVLSATVADGGTQLVFTFRGFDPGEKLLVSLDVDEQGYPDPLDPNPANAVCEGKEFQSSKLLASFDAPNFYEASGMARFYDEFTLTTGLDLPQDNYMPPGKEEHPELTAGAFFPLTQTPLPITLAGTVYEDLNLDNVHDTGEMGIGGVNLTLWELVDGNYVATGKTTTTDATGNYKFEGVLPGTYRVAETQPDGFFSIGATAGTVSGATRGTVTGVDEISGVSLVGGEDSVHNDFAEAKPATLSGHVYHDADNDGVRDPGETGIGGATVRIQYLPPSDAAPAAIEVKTNADGSWSAGNLRPGNYLVEEVQPTGYLDGLDAAGTAGGEAHNPGDSISGVHLNSGQVGLEYNFGELVPSTISGRVVADANANAAYDNGEELLAGVTVRLLDSSGKVVATTVTDEKGEYAFTDLAPGVYGVEELQPQGYYDGADTVGSVGGSLLPPDSIIDVVLVSGTTAIRYDFYELLPGSISGRVAADANANGAYDPGETLLSGVTVYLLDASGNRIKNTQTDANGEYRFVNLAPGLYGVEEAQPEGYLDGADKLGSEGGALVAPDTMTGIKLVSGTDAVRYDFLEILPSCISGHVIADTNGNGTLDAGEKLLSGVTVYLLDASGNRIATTETDAEGLYKFCNLTPGTYGVEEVQPQGYFDGSDKLGSEGGQLLPPDTMTSIVLVSGTRAQQYDFYELPPVTLSGYVYADDDNNGVRGPGEAGIAGVTLQLLDSRGQPTGVTAVTDANGFYRFEGLEPGKVYGVAEQQPAGYSDGLDTAGTAGGAAHNPGDSITGAKLKPGVHGKNYNFGELRPVSISGRVLMDRNSSNSVDGGDSPIAGVTVWLLNGDGNRMASTQTDANGRYQFTNLPPGAYGVEEIQPQGYYDGADKIGTAGGTLVANDRISGAALGSGVNATDYDFLELAPATISGYVFQDGPAIYVDEGEPAPDPATLRDGKRTADDKPLAGVVLRLGDASGAPILDASGQPITAVTDANGYYQFTGLEPGLYTVLESQPGGYIDSIDTAGSNGGVAINPHDDIDPMILSTLAVDPHDDAIVRIPVASGETALSYNFSEVVVEDVPPVGPPPDTPPLPPLSPSTPEPAFVSEPMVRTVYNPAPTQRPLGLFGGGGGVPVAYTWHLSVVDGGQPRRNDSSDQVANSPSVYFNPASWNGADMNRAEWTILDGQGKKLKKIVFGIEGGIPVVGDFDGNGTIDVGVFFDGLWFLDLNGNGVWDDGDLWARLGRDGDQPVTGDWDGDGKTDLGIFGMAWKGDHRAITHEPGLPDSDNFDTTGRYKNVPPTPEQATDGLRTMKRTAQGPLRSDLIDHVFQYGSEGDVAVAGDWNGDGVSNIGLFRGGIWYLDANGNGRWDDGDAYVENVGAPGDIPVVGDFNGDGIDDLGVYRGGTWYLDANGDRRLDAHDKVFKLGGMHDRPFVGDFNGDGIDEVGVYQDGVSSPDKQADTDSAEGPAEEVATQPSAATRQ
jgi:protocatechuate 3,4-dioxygenase beta subunit